MAELGLKYVHNDTCYPALLVIGQFMDALDSGKYDLDHTALIITQTGGGCRASNYIHLLRKALEKAGYGNVPVLSLNFSGLEKDSGLPHGLCRSSAGCWLPSIYGDLLMTLANQTQPYELEKGAAARMQEHWLDIAALSSLRDEQGLLRPGDARRTCRRSPQDFAAIPVTRRAQGEGGRGGRDLCEILPSGQQRSGEVPCLRRTARSTCRG